MPCSKFSSSQDEVEYYKNLAEEYKMKFSEAQAELDEFQEGSRDLESELETQLTQAEARNRELAAANAQLQADCDRLQVGYFTYYGYIFRLI
ncbi:hypothetical protein JTE90_017696 [Oedothorax gibbosus]|uniref:Uncharacterized protein n=1 Tax=Oedothorax gibbosus TaxID=931172 RepID=A0AAV6U7I0_9ARAC|nr:hypothetical protein JTE90_017696 [Oedothorax gibbosus]